MAWVAFLLTLLAAGVGCAEPALLECRTSQDCGGSPCVSGECHDRSTPSIHAIHGSDAGSYGTIDAESSADVPRRRGPCADLVPAGPDNLIVNELLANVPVGASGDANGDGIRDAFDDEFIELVNVSSDPVDLTNVRIAVGGKLKFSFEPICLHAGHSVVVFGGGSVGSSVAGSAVISEVRFGFSNSGGNVTVTSPSGVVASFAYPETGPGSLTLSPQIVGASFVEHRSVSALAFSPGRCADGSDITSGCVAEGGPDMGIEDLGERVD